MSISDIKYPSTAGGGGGSGGGVIDLPGVNPDASQTNTIQVGTDGKVYIVDGSGDITPLAITPNGTLSLKSLDTLGTVYSTAWNHSPLTNFTFSGAATVVTNSGGTTITGPGYNLSNAMVFNKNISVENYKIKFQIEVLAKDSSSRGIAFNIPGNTGMGQGVTASFLLKDTEGYIAYMPTTNLSDGSNTSQTNSILVWEIGDILTITIEKAVRTFTFTIFNETTGSTSRLVVTGIFPQAGKPTLYFLANTKLVGNFTIEYNEISKPTIAAVGDSITWGGTLPNPLEGYVSILTDLVGGYGVQMSAPAQTSAAGLLNIDDILVVQPQVLVYAYGTNDLGTGISVPTFKSNVTSVVTAALGIGAKVVLLSIVPQVSDISAYDTALQEVQAAHPNVYYVEMTTELQEPGHLYMRDIYSSGDSIHPNSFAHPVIANMAYDTIRNIITPAVSPLKCIFPTTANDFLPSLKIKPDGTIVAVKAGQSATWGTTGNIATLVGNGTITVSPNTLRFIGGIQITSLDATGPHIWLRNGNNPYTGTWRIGASQYTGGGNDDFYLYNDNLGIFGMFIDAQSNNAGFNVQDTPTSGVDIGGNSIRIRTTKTPSSASDTGVKGTICWDSSFVYVCIDTNTWKRVAISTW